MPGPQSPPIPPQAPPVGGGPGVLLTRDAATRTRATVRFVESTFLAPAGPRPRRAARGGQVASCWARTTGTISARSGANCGSGTAVLCSVSASGVLSDTSTTITIWNGVDQAIASGSGKYFLAIWANGKWWLAVPGSCDFLS